MSLFPGWLIAVLMLLGVLLAFVVVVAAGVRKSSAPGDSGRLVLVVGRFLAIVYAVITVIATTLAVVSALFSRSVLVSLPVQEFWPGVHPWITLDPSPAATVVGGGITTAEVSVDGLSVGVRILLAGGHALEGLTFTLIAVVIALLCHRLLGGSPFKPLLARSITVMAATIASGGIAWQLCYGIGGSIASEEVLRVTGYAGKAPSDAVADYLFTTFPSSGLPDPALAIQIDFWPLFLGLALAAVAIAFRYGERLQRDTEGLV